MDLASSTGSAWAGGQAASLAFSSLRNPRRGSNHRQVVGTNHRQGEDSDSDAGGRDSAPPCRTPDLIAAGVMVGQQTPRGLKSLSSTQQSNQRTKGPNLRKLKVLVDESADARERAMYGVLPSSGFLLPMTTPSARASRKRKEALARFLVQEEDPRSAANAGQSESSRSVVPPPMLHVHRTFEHTKNIPVKHVDCLMLPPPVDRLWLLLRPNERPSPQQLMHTARSECVSARAAMAKALFGPQGQRLLESFEQLLASEQRNRQAEKNIRNAARASAKAMLEGTTLITKPSSACSSTAEVEPEEPIMMLNLNDWSQRHPDVSIDSRVLAMAAIAGQTVRPVHAHVVVDRSDLRDLNLLGMWEGLRKLSTRGSSKLTNVDGLARCKDLEEVDLAYCESLRDVSALANCPRLKSLNMQSCSSLSSVIKETPDGLCGLLALKELEWVDIEGCDILPVEEVRLLWKHLRRPHGNRADSKTERPAMVMLSLQMMNNVVKDYNLSDQQEMRTEARRAAHQKLETESRAFDLLGQPPIACSWERFEEGIQRLYVSIKLSEALGVDRSTTALFYEKYRAMKLKFYLEHKISPQEVAQLQKNCKQRTKARFARSPAAMKYLQIEVADSIPPYDFITMVAEFGYEDDTSVLIKVFEYLDVQRKWYLCREDFTRLADYGGPASLETMDEFRRFVFDRFGGFSGSWSLVDREGKGELKFDDFQAALSKLGWKGSTAREIFISLDASRRDGAVSEGEFETLQLYYLGQVEVFRQWMKDAYGSLNRAFLAIDDNGSGELSMEELKAALTRQKYPNVRDAIKAFEMLDTDCSQMVSRHEFDRLARFNAREFLSELERLRNFAVLHFGDLDTCFDAMRRTVNDPIPDDDGVLNGEQPARKESLGIEMLLERPESGAGASSPRTIGVVQALQSTERPESNPRASPDADAEQSPSPAPLPPLTEDEPITALVDQGRPSLGKGFLAKVVNTKVRRSLTDQGDDDDKGGLSYRQFSETLEAFHFTGSKDTRLLYHFLDYDHGGCISRAEWATLASFNIEMDRRAVEKFRHWLIERFGSYDEGFDAFRDLIRERNHQRAASKSSKLGGAQEATSPKVIRSSMLGSRTATAATKED